VALVFLGACGRTNLSPAQPLPANPPIDCSGSDTQTDNQNCGACGNRCSASAPSTATCALGRCLVTLAASDTYARFAVGASDVYWTIWGGTEVMKVPTGGGSPVAFVSGQSSPNGLALDATHVYWTNYDLYGTVSKAPIAGGRPITLATNQTFPPTVTVHATGVYWTTWASYGRNGSVMKLPSSGGGPVTVASRQDHPDAISLDATDVFWTSGGTLMKAPIAGGTPTTFISAPGAYGRLVVSGGNAYYCQYEEDADVGTVMKVPTGGGTPVVLASGRPVYIAVDAESVYWTDDDPTGGVNGQILKVPVGGGETTVLATGQDGPDRIAVDQASVYWTNYNSNGNGAGMSLMKLTPK
jgi:hypothetical protein